jgi:hypothetical protein
VSWSKAALVETPNQWLAATPAEVFDALQAVTDEAELHQLVMAIVAREDLVHHVVTYELHGQSYRRRLNAFVADARTRCTTPPTTTRST